jgi:phage terminase small subunit
MTTKEQIWLAEYFKCWNATEAARRADYAWPDKEGAKKKAKFADEIKARIEEIQMDADEVLRRLAEHARGDIGEFASIANSVELAEHPLSRIIKKYKKRIYRPKNGEPYEEIELELYDAHSALVDIGKHLALFTDKVEHSGNVTTGPVNIVVEMPKEE